MKCDPRADLDAMDNETLQKEILRADAILKANLGDESAADEAKERLNRAADKLEERRKEGRERSIINGRSTSGRKNKFVKRSPGKKVTAKKKTPPIDDDGPITYKKVLPYFKFLFGAKGMRILRAFNRSGNTWEFCDIWGDFDIDWISATGKSSWLRVNVQIEEDISPIQAAMLMMRGLEETRVYWHDGLTDDQVEDWQAFYKAYVSEAAMLAVAAAEFELSVIGIANEGADWVLTIDEVSSGNFGAIWAMLPFLSVGMVKVVDRAGNVAARRAATLHLNNTWGTAFEKHVYKTKLKGVDDVGRLRIQEDILDSSRPMKTRRPDWQIWNTKGGLAAILDAKTGRTIDLDGQAKEFIHSAYGGKLIYYVPNRTDGTVLTVTDRLRDYAAECKVDLQIIEVPWDGALD